MFRVKPYIYHVFKQALLHVFEEIKPLRAFLQVEKEAHRTVGLVPTMGALHAGHLRLIEASKKENDLTVCSIYVNPTQFNNLADLEKYPRTFDQDSEILKNAGCDVIFAPTTNEMYKLKTEIKFDFGVLDKVLEGKYRPGHFSGVALVVSKLFNIVQPRRAYFGQKDYQQLKIVSLLTHELMFDIEIQPIPIVREPDGLAMSSRNQRLNPEDRKNALVLYECLASAKRMLQSGACVADVKQMATNKCSTVPNVKLEYFELADVENLLPTETVSDKTILLMAAYVGQVRLIDNLKMD
jgi:pantoate--beta-alanine ligase